MRKNYNDSCKESRKFSDSPYTQYEYRTLAGIVACLDEGIELDRNSNRSDAARKILGYVYGDLDYGSGDSFDLYLLDKGISPESYDKQYRKASDEYEKAIKSVVKDMLGEYGKESYDERWPFDNVNNVVSRVIYDIDQDRNNSVAYTGDLEKADEERYKKMLNKAHDYYYDFSISPYKLFDMITD